MARRVFVSVSKNSPLFNAAWEDPEMVVLEAFRLVQHHGLVPSGSAPATRLLAVERWNRIHLVFDIGHDAYDAGTAHLPEENKLTVLAVHFSGKGTQGTETAKPAPGKLADEVNKEIQEIHDLTGIGSQPPFIIDHANGKVPVYSNPRTMRRN
ncbi:hypothetical protein KVR01_012506 [Diaporthe batatas]|uniref:uncharacterized protein n=1 Tax=Diaporthe batatas TaxID=748121 RepID=UPI001D0552C5|nr:uncharacterized protein KVR01_012506 [Diaporthe batatas]KAG8157844.1 hypothetical protein KVR01_012506 [Diaporthe batatas]